jgi:ribose transport system substrate-binding protein
LVAVAAVAAVAACGSSSSSASSSSKSSGSTSTSSSSKHVNIALELVLTGVKFAQDDALGMRTAAADIGNTSVSTNGPPSTDPVLAQQQAAQASAQSPDAMAVDPFTPDLWQHSLSTLSKQVPQFLVMNDKPVLTPSQVGSALVHIYVGIDDTAYAADLATATIKNAGISPSTTGTVLLGQCVPGTVGVLAERTRGYLTVVHKLLPRATVIQFNSQVLPQLNTSAWTAELEAHPNPVLALGTCDQDGASLDIVKKKLGQHFVAAGIDLTPQALSGVADGTLTDDMVDDYFVQGYAVTWLLAHAARGTPLPAGWVNTGYTLITKKNVAAITAAQSSPSAIAAYWMPYVKTVIGNLPAVTHPLADAWSL